MSARAALQVWADLANIADLKAVSEARRQTLLEEITRSAEFAIAIDPLLRQATLASEDRANLWVWKKKPRLANAMLSAFHKAAHDVVVRLLDGDLVTWASLGPLGLEAAFILDGTGTVRLHYNDLGGGKWPGRFLVWLLVPDHLFIFRRCKNPGCASVFVRHRRAAYCSPSCRNAVSDAQRSGLKKRRLQQKQASQRYRERKKLAKKGSEP